jgi:hypothetical protein
MKTPYSFTVLRYFHDVMTGEFVNVGVVLYSPQPNFLDCRITQLYGRLSKVFGEVNGDHFRKIVKYISSQLEEKGDRLKTELPFTKYQSVLDVVGTVLPPDNSSLQFSPAGYGVAEDLQKTLEHLYLRYVEKYQERPAKYSRSDEDVWRTFKKPLEENHVLAHLTSHQMVSPNYEYVFEYAWKNNIWHINQPISLDLIEPSYIIEKANNWLGKMTNLTENNESTFKMYFLLGEPSNPKAKSALIKAKNIIHKIPCDHDFISEGEAEKFAEELRNKIKEHSDDLH